MLVFGEPQMTVNKLVFGKPQMTVNKLVFGKQQIIVYNLIFGESHVTSLESKRARWYLARNRKKCGS